MVISIIIISCEVLASGRPDGHESSLEEEPSLDTAGT